MIEQRMDLIPGFFSYSIVSDALVEGSRGYNSTSEVPNVDLPHTGCHDQNMIGWRYNVGIGNKPNFGLLVHLLCDLQKNIRLLEDSGINRRQLTRFGARYSRNSPRYCNREGHFIRHLGFKPERFWASGIRTSSVLSLQTRKLTAAGLHRRVPEPNRPGRGKPMVTKLTVNGRRNRLPYRVISGAIIR